MKDFRLLKSSSEKLGSSIKLQEISNKDIAIIGVGLKFPKADTCNGFWNNIRQKMDCIGPIPSSRQEDLENYLQASNNKDQYKGYQKLAYINEIDKFDYHFFNLSPKEAGLMDPHQRLFLETAWHAIEDAGYGGNKLMGSRTGVYIGFGQDASYAKMISEVDPSSISIATPGNLSAMIPSRISYLLDLKGPSISINTACSSSLVALHYACQGIRNGDCQMAIAGSVKIALFPFIKDYKLGIESSDGRTKTFDDDSDGTIGGEGVVAFLLKPLSKALEDKDSIYAVIKGSAINQDGRSNGLTAPHPAAQADVLVRAWKDAGINPETISLIEAHGTGTKLGDPIEIEGIQRAFSMYTEKKQFCAIGSIKTNIGHLDHAAGLAGVLKAMLALKHKELPPSLHFSKPNKNINFIESPVYVNDQARLWEKQNFPRRCGVSSFGLSGTNCHVVLEEAPFIDRTYSTEEDNSLVLTLSAKREEVLIRLVMQYKGFLESENQFLMRDVCYTANTGRGHYSHRLALLFRNKEELIKRIDYILQHGFTDEAEGIYWNDNKDYTKEKNIRDLSSQGICLLNDFHGDEADKEELLKDLCQLYIQGAEIDWDKLYTDQEVRHVHIPVYPFEKTRCWLPIPKRQNDMDTYDHVSSYYTIHWQPKALEKVKVKTRGTVLILNDQEGFGEKMTEALRAEEKEVIQVHTGKAFKKLHDDLYTIDGSEEDYARLMEDIKDKNLTQIIHLQTLSNRSPIENKAQLETSLQKGLYSLFYVTKALIKYAGRNSLDIVVISNEAGLVSGQEENISPHHAAMSGLAKVIDEEYPHFHCRCIDIDRHTKVSTLIQELISNEPVFQVAYRHQRRYMKALKKVEFKDVAQKAVEIKEHGVYIITGGLGGIGLHVAKYIASKKKVQLVLINRTQLPNRNQWQDVLKQDQSTKGCNQIRAIMEIEKMGTQVFLYSADVSKEEITKVMEEIRNKQGAISGIFHCAGIASEGFLFKKSREQFRQVIAPKIYGTWLLHHATQNDNLDFIVMFSSLASIFGGKGQGDYAAANMYLDTFAAYRNKIGKKTISINWPAWKEVGMAVDYGAVHEDGLFKTLTNKEAIDALDQILQKDLRSVLVMDVTPNNKNIIEQSFLPVKAHETLPTHWEVTLKGREHEQDYTNTEKQMALLWGKILGIKEVDIHDDFFQLGGNSILTIQLEVEAEKSHLPITITDIYDYPTIEKLASYVESSPAIIQSNKNEKLSTEMVKDDGENAKVLEPIKPFNDIFYKSCFYNSLFPIVHYFHRDILPFLANDIVTYTTDKSKKGIQIKATCVPCMTDEQILKDMGIVTKSKRVSDSIIDHVMDALKKNRPVIVPVDCFYEPLRPDEYQKIHWQHSLLVYGFDEETKEFHIIEHQHRHNLFYKKHRISYQDLSNSYEGHMKHFETKNDKAYFYEYHLEDDERRPFESDKGKYRDIHLSRLKENKDMVYNGLEELALFMDELKSYMDEKCSKINIEDLLQCLNNIINMKEIQKYQIIQLFGDEMELLGLLDQIIEHWMFFRGVIAKYMFSSVYDKEAFSLVLEKSKEIYRLEKEYYNIIYN